MSTLDVPATRPRARQAALPGLLGTTEAYDFFVCTYLGEETVVPPDAVMATSQELGAAQSGSGARQR